MSCASALLHLSLICWSLSKSLIDSKLRVTCKVGSLSTRIFTLAVPRIEEEKADGTSMWHSLGHGHRNRSTKDDTLRIVRFAELPHGPCAESNENSCFDDEPAEVSLSVNLPLSDGVSHDGEIVSFAGKLDERICQPFIRLAFAVQVNCLVVEFFELWARYRREIHLYLLLFFSIY